MVARVLVFHDPQVCAVQAGEKQILYVGNYLDLRLTVKTIKFWVALSQAERWQLLFLCRFFNYPYEISDATKRRKNSLCRIVNIEQP